MSHAPEVPGDAPDVADAERLDEATGKKLVKVAGAVAALGLLLCIAAYATDAKRFAFSYLTGFMWVVTIGLGALFFVILQHITKAGWSVAARRHMEWVSAILPVAIVLAIPVVLGAHDLYHHWMGPQAATDPILVKKVAWLNPGFFYARLAIYFTLWATLAWWFARTSRKQDESGDVELTHSMQRVSAPSVLLFALSLSFGAFDILMSLAPHWYSTIFGIYIFAGSVVSALAVLALITVGLQGGGWLKRVSTVEHQHDVGKLMFAFTVFWAYRGFSQFMLIWYANMPEETIWFHERWQGSWKAVSLTLLFGHFIVPFCFLLSRHVKRHKRALVAAAIWMLAMHYVDLYWMIMPTLDTGSAHPSWIDLAGLLGPLGVLALVIACKASRGPLYPLRDPRLAETRRHVNL